MVNFDFPVKIKYVIFIKSFINASTKSTTLYNMNLSNEKIKELFYNMLVAEREIFIDSEKRIPFDEPMNCKSTHNIQILLNNKNIGSFSFSEKCYSCDEMIDKINYWLKHNTKIPKSEVKKILESENK